eukprot:g7038.t1
MRRKNTYTKFCDSLLQKSAKVRSLVTDLKKNYESDPCVDKSIKALEHDLDTLEDNYNKCSEELATGESVGYTEMWVTKFEKTMKETTFACTKVVQNEAKIRNAKRHFRKVPKKEES